ncbi:MAG: 4Fe-4S dicluster domain-containing protein [Sedimentisphaerales bacterium]|nr:4Fe-4S dicluster domain-containing protein [Sedimentisphaerales bacterium]
MGLRSGCKIDTDFSGGIYLPAVGAVPAMDSIETVEYVGDLFLPLEVDGREIAVEVNPDKSVCQGDILGRTDGYLLRAPRSGDLAGRRKIRTSRGRRCDSLVLRIKNRSEAENHSEAEKSSDQAEHSEDALVPGGIVGSSEAAHAIVLQKIEQAGIVEECSGQPLAKLLERQSGKTYAVVANVVPLEETLNGPLTILQFWPEQVYAGLTILKKFLAADRALLAWPHNFALDKRTARAWEIRAVPVSGKYPQGRPDALVRTLRKRRLVPTRKTKENSTLVVTPQLLRQVERAVLADSFALERLVTVCGDMVKKPGHYLVPIGMPLVELLKQAEITAQPHHVISGCSLAGKAVDAEQTVVDQCCESVMALHRLPRTAAHHCIRCGWCIDFCPAQIDPAQLMQFAETGQYHQANEIAVNTCLECGICSYICPSNLRIMENIQIIKRKLQPDKSAGKRGRK